MTRTPEKQEELDQLRARVRELEGELGENGNGGPRGQWEATSYYTAYYATTGFLLGAVAAMTSLLLNIVGSLVFEKHPLQLIRVYLTFPMGEQALDYDAVNNGLILAAGCCLYIAMGMFYGMLFQIVLSLFTAHSSLAARFVVVSLLALAVLLFGGRWIVEQIPWWVAAATHLVFGWTMLIVYPLGRYQPYRLETQAS